MKLSSISWLLIIPVCLGSWARGQVAGHQDFELVESTPVETILDNPDIRNAREVWLEMINGARKSLEIEEFYISNKAGEPLEDVIEAIEHAADRGVTVRVIAEAGFYKTYPETIDRLRKKDNITVRLLNLGKITGGIQHAKYFIVDDESIFLGSQNFDWRSLEHIHELGLRIHNSEAVRVYLDIFNLDWKLSESNDPRVIKTDLVPRRYAVPFYSISGGDTITYTPTFSPIGLIIDSTLWDEPNIVRVIESAKDEVSMQFLGYDTRDRRGQEYRVLDDAVRRAAARGVKVRLLVADWEKGTAGERSLKDLATVPNVEVKFSDIPEWSGGYIPFARVEHCKFVLADSSVFWLGTSNAEKSYFYRVRNVGVVVASRTLAPILHKVFEKSWEGPYVEPVDPGKQYEKREHGEK